MAKNCCDYGHETNQPVKRLPIGEDSAVIVCRTHFLAEISWRKSRNEDLEESCKFDLPKWEDLKVYEVE